MLHKYAFSNFQSFLDRTEVDLTLSGKVTLTDWMERADTGERVSKLMAVIGSNGSGKTALIKPLAFLGWFIAASFQHPHNEPIPLTPHFAAEDEPSEFEVLLDFDGKLWRYVLRCTRQRVLHEALYVKRERFNYVFIRNWESKSQTYTVKQHEFGLPQQEAAKVRQNVSLIAWSAQFGVELARRMTAPYVVSNISFLGRVSALTDPMILPNAAKHFSEKLHQRELMKSLLASWDLGLTGVELSEIASQDPQGGLQKVWWPFGQHQVRGSNYKLPLFLESSGTQSAFILLSKLLDALEIGGLAVIDEFENDLHPHMIEPILDLFANPATNPHKAQLVFTCHAIEVLNLVHKSQVMLTEKDENCESSAIRMDKIGGIRNDDNYYAKYMSGTYGSVPDFG